MALPSFQHKNAAKLLEEHGEKFLETYKLKKYDNLLSGLANEQLSQDFLMHCTDSGINLTCLSQEHPPNISGTIHIDKQLKDCLHDDQQLLPCSSYKHIVAAGDVTLFISGDKFNSFSKVF